MLAAPSRLRGTSRSPRGDDGSGSLQPTDKPTSGRVTAGGGTALGGLRGVTRSGLELLELLAVVCGLTLFLFAAAGLLLATMRVAVRGRILVLPFGGKDDRRVELTDLYVRRLTEMEGEWIKLARQIQQTREEVNGRAERDWLAHASNLLERPLLAEGIALPQSLPEHGSAAVAASALRTSGDELVDDVVQLAKAGSISEADLGVVSLAGVSFSPQAILALLRAAPSVLARRILRGSILEAGGVTRFTVEYEERSLRGHRRRAVHSTDVRNDEWLAAIEDVSFRLAKERIYLVRDRTRPPEQQSRRDERSQRRLRRTGDSRAADSRAACNGADLMSARSETVRQAIIEATSWEACRAFLMGYAAHLEHYSHGRASARDDALAHYDRALMAQVGFPRAAYNRANLLYNKYLPDANDHAILDFELATRSNDPSLRPLAFAGVAMAHCQAIHRFRRESGLHEKKARNAAAEAMRLAPALEEVRFVEGWIHQIHGDWSKAISTYESVSRLPGDSAPALRVKSFALNNAAWIWMNELNRTRGSDSEEIRAAETLLWRALAFYPNKQTYSNLAEIARRVNRLDDSVKLLQAALSLDATYANAKNELAVVEAELGAAAAREGRTRDGQRHLETARAQFEGAQELAVSDSSFARRLESDYRAAERACVAALNVGAGGSRDAFRL
jgi:tetratricopeptide (TPR) repeat protein